jgi:Zinc carboxypeptidase
MLHPHMQWRFLLPIHPAILPFCKYLWRLYRNAVICRTLNFKYFTMRKRWLLLLSVVFTGISAFGQSLQSPEAFLGYSLGSKYTQHYKIVNYVKQVAAAAPSMVKTAKYGETNEGRELMLAFVASPENLSRLEAIRINNLRLSGILKDAPGDVNYPAIVWLSYNVHGNEPSSSEAAMKTLYELVNPANNQTKQWLRNTVVVIDPCMNPDGRDRYVNWITSILGSKPNALPNSREHSEPWPGGRSNHYNFDLNRDWAWQTQVESRQRAVVYNDWLPQVHVDYHEQGYNEPYYFAPAAEPFHEVITNWQREFQTQIGRNNARYFDANGWLYFTKERFDLFYPSYGDTYPTYNGSIGMTYEQGGHSRGGLAVITEDGDTLTLLDRLTHHYTTGISTIEISSRNAKRLVEEFKKYFDNARNNPSGDYKSYVVKTTPGAKKQALLTLLDNNGIEYGNPATGNLNGLNYFTGKNEAFTTAPTDIVINANQPKSNMVRVLFERMSKLSDSATYDITAWSLPFAYGFNAYGVKEYIKSTEVYDTKTMIPSADAISDNIYAYLVKWNGLDGARFLSEVLQKGVRVRYAEQPFTVNKTTYEKGTLIITRAANMKLGSNLKKIVFDARAYLTPGQFEMLETGFVDKGFDLGSDRVRMIQTPRVALLTGSGVSSLGAGEWWNFFDNQLQYPITLINADELNMAALKNIDVLVMPDGYYRMLNDKNTNEQLKNWVSSGGRLIALEGALSQLSRNEWGFKLKTAEDKKEDDKGDKKEDYSALKKYENRERDYLVNNIPGSIYKVELDNSHPLAFGYPDFYYTIKQDDNIYEFFKEGGWNVGVIKKESLISGFVGTKPKEKLKDGLLFGVAEMGRGQVVLLTDNPLFRSFWENGKLLICNAVFMVGQ